ncbi:MAG: tetratricopeptide repeat protein, partial [Verrucomicrobia bacterium]|nr:tetratricopeptide repeat protein [Verrucomicrobiota bacterium]
MTGWVPLRKSGRQKSASISVASAVGPTATRSVSGTRLEAGALGALLTLCPLFLTAQEPGRAGRVDAALFFAEGRRADILGESSQALTAYSKALSSDPSSRQAALAKAATLLDLNRTAEALEILLALPSTPEDEPERGTLLCLAYLGEKKGEAAWLAQRDALAALAGWQVDDPARLARVSEGLLRSSLSLSRKSQREIAASVLPAFIRAADLDPSLTGVALRAAEIALAADDLPTSIRFLREFVEARPEEIPLQEQLAALLLLNGQPEEADTILHEVEKEKPGRANLYPVLANLYDELNLPGRSEIYRVLALYGNRPPALNDLLRLALLQLRENQPRRAFATVEYGSGFYPDSLQLLLVQGMAQKAQNRMAEAAATFAKVERLAQLRPELLDAGFYFEFGAALEQAGQPLRSETALRRAIALNPDHHQALNYLGYMWAERGRKLKEAKSLIGRALELNPDNPAYLDSLAWALFRMGDPRGAESLMVKALQQVPDDPIL